MSDDVLSRLRAFSTPTIANALECLGVDPARGFTDPTIACRTPGLGSMVGYAVTACVRSFEPREPAEPAVANADYWSWVSGRPKPAVAFVHDLDPEPLGSMWGEVNASIHRALGCVGMVTDGAFRDVDEVRRLGFHAFSGTISVSHAHARWVGFGEPVEVGGLRVEPGSLVHGDRHGVLLIEPHVDLDELVRAATELESLEREVIGYCREPGFAVDVLVERYGEMLRRWPRRGAGPVEIV